MTVDVECADCDWWDEREVSNIPLCCPQCHSAVERASEPIEDDGTWRSGEV